jgi:hypothetical protein
MADDARVLHPERVLSFPPLRRTTRAVRRRWVPIVAALRAAIHAWRGSTLAIPGITSIQGIKTNV